MKNINPMEIKGVLLDYGGVLAEEGFREGLKALAVENGLSPDDFFETATDAVYESGYVVGASEELAYWDLLRDETGIRGSDEHFRKQILDRFVLRSWMIQVVRSLKKIGAKVAILSDQTQWLDELDARDGFFREFDAVFNSFHLGRGKRDPKIFSEVAAELGIEPAQLVFVDDNRGHVERARSQGLNAILFTDRESFLAQLRELGLLP
ncbi:MAG: HAD family phosphatase [Desulfomonile tiedjei]|uniref:HAD family phosphatase n=1 Tax=Desulfomonile tiedjei TaxID=2358 RepID=A0A9D6Z2R2_9BACT|nr:HAD family phosphatase [Desulfomonile tiedjei]